jgi:hypothetical protein
VNSRTLLPIFLALSAILATLLFLETGLRAYGLFRGIGFFQPGDTPLTQPIRKPIPFRTFGFDPYVFVEGKMLISDTWGRRFPLEKESGAYRIVCFGGSTTEGKSEEQQYPKLLQDELRSRSGGNVEVINVGSAAYATPHSIILLAFDVISWQPDLVVLSHNINDLLAMYFPGFRPDYWNKYGHEFFASPDYSTRYTWRNVLFQHSRLYWFVRERLSRIRPRSPEIRRAPYDEEDVRRAQAVFERNLRTFVHIAGSYHIPVILGTQPLEPSEEYFLRHMVEKTYHDTVVFPPHEEFVRHHDDYNQSIRNVSREANVGLVDNARVMSGRTEYFVDFVHYSEIGCRTLARSYADAIAETYLPTAMTGR